VTACSMQTCLYEFVNSQVLLFCKKEQSRR